jgi:uncharacterized protein YbjT (DUF2867 family)
MTNDSRLVLLTGATGYIGGRLVPRLLEAGYPIRCLVRESGRLQGRPWSDQVEVIEGDTLQPETLPAAMKDVWATYYLIHSLSDTRGNHDRDVVGARNFGQAAQEAGVERIFYLGGLGHPDAAGSALLRSRQEAGVALAQAGVPVTEFRAALIVGAGSLCFEMIRYLVERQPVAFCPCWAHTRNQPTAIRDLLRHMVAALKVPESAGRIIEVGGADVLTFAEMMKGYAEVRGLRCYVVTVPVRAPRLSAQWVHWITPVHAALAYPIIEGLRSEAVVRDDAARRLFPDIRPEGYETAVRQALANLEEGRVETSWSDSLASTLGDGRLVELTSHEGLKMLVRQKVVDARPEHVWAVFSRLGGEQGWLYADWLWRLRGVVDRLLGGPGFRRSRRDPDEVRVGDALGFFRVEAVEPGHLMRLRSEMKMPGRAWLQLEARPQENGRTLLVQAAFMVPKGLPGLLYWFGLYPIHSVLFSGMISEIAARAEAMAGT